MGYSDHQLCGTGYDGAPNMSSSVCGVQDRIQQHAPLSFYTHCQAHQLNLCVVKACRIPDLQNVNSVISEIAKIIITLQKGSIFLST